MSALDLKLKPCSPLVTGLFILATLLHLPTHGYGSVGCLLLVVVVMGGQLLLQHQLKQDAQVIANAQSALANTALGENERQQAVQSALFTIERLLVEHQWLSDESKIALQQRHQALCAQANLPH